MQIQAHMGHGTMSNYVEETGKDGRDGNKIAISLVGNEMSTFGNGGGQVQMQANGVIPVAIKSNNCSSNGNGNVENNGNVGGAITTSNDCTKTCIGLSNGSKGSMGGVAKKDNEGTRAEVEVGVKSVSDVASSASGVQVLPPCSNGVKSVSALLNGMQLSYQAKAVGAVLTGKVTYNELEKSYKYQEIF